MEQIKVGIAGTGYIGISHLQALRQIGGIQVVAVADVNVEKAQKTAAQYGIEKVYDTIQALVTDPEIRVIHDCTPNYMHFDVSSRAILAGKHIFSEKPLAQDSGESAKLLRLLAAHPEVIGGVNFCYRMYPLMQEMRLRIAAGEIGKPNLVHGSYLQDWLLFDTDYNWRCEKKYGGASRAVADIGSHWMDLAQNVTGSKIVEVCACLKTAIPVRKKPAAVSDTFAGTSAMADCIPVKIDTEDYAGALLRFDNGAVGVLQCSQISAGRKCFIDIEVDGSMSSFHWNHEHSNRMWKGNRDSQNEEIMRNPLLIPPEARAYTHLAAGHAEGWNDAFQNNIASFYRFMKAGKQADGVCDFATFEEAHYIMCITDAILLSAREHRWVEVNESLNNLIPSDEEKRRR